MPAQISPQDQQAVQRVVIAAMKIVHSPAVVQQILKIMKTAQGPQGVGAALLFVMKGIYEKSQRSIPPNVLVLAGKEVCQMIAQVGEAAGILKDSPQLEQQAMQIAIQQLKQEVAQGRQAAPAQGAPASAVPAATAQPPQMPAPAALQ